MFVFIYINFLLHFCSVHDIIWNQSTNILCFLSKCAIKFHDSQWILSHNISLLFLTISNIYLFPSIQLSVLTISQNIILLLRIQSSRTVCKINNNNKNDFLLFSVYISSQFSYLSHFLQSTLQTCCPKVNTVKALNCLFGRIPWSSSSS